MAGQHGVRSLQQTKHNIFVLGTYYIMGLRHFRTEMFYEFNVFKIYIYNLWLIICWDLMFNVVMFLICNVFRDYVF